MLSFLSKANKNGESRMFSGKKRLLVLAGSANVGYKIDLSETDSITFGGYIKGDVHYIDGDASSTLTNDDFWIGHVVKDDISNTRMHADSTRFNTKYANDDVTALLKWTFW